MKSVQMNVLGKPLQTCSETLITGFYRDGFCHLGPDDQGIHSVCAQMTGEFLSFSKLQGNDLMTPRPEFGFAGLKEGDFWCLCLTRWLEAYQAGNAPKLKLESTHHSLLEFVPFQELQQTYCV